MEFKVGDVVRLKSGGPLMTVHESRELSDYLEVVWSGGSDVRFCTVHKQAVVVCEPDQTDLGASDDRPLGPDSPVCRQGSE